MKSLAFCTLQYATDSDERLPPRPAVAFHPDLAAGLVSTGPPDLAKCFPPDDWHRQIRYRNGQVFVCPSTGSIYSYDFNLQVYGVVAEKLEDPDKTVMEFENGFLTGSPRGPHQGGYNTTYCDGRGAWVPHAFAPGDDIRLH
ncbi:hypothetical protein LLH23_21115 [bacterium]|nr:hypothetical protein [bacterium]